MIPAACWYFNILQGCVRNLWWFLVWLFFPHSFMQDKVLKKMVAEVLDMEEFDAGAMCGRLSHISTYGDMLTFHFHDGHTETRKYIPGKRGYRRKEGKPCREEG